MSFRTVISLVLAAVTFLGALPLSAQRVYAEGRAGVSVGHHIPSFAGLKPNPGDAISGTVGLRLFSAAYAFATYAQTSFTCEGGFCEGLEVDIVSRDILTGILIQPARSHWFRAALGQHRSDVVTLDAQSQGPDLRGYELAGGLQLGIGRFIGITPGIFYRNQFGEERTAILGADLGVKIQY